jgi:hypothetical protein
MKIKTKIFKHVTMGALILSIKDFKNIEKDITILHGHNNCSTKI